MIQAGSMDNPDVVTPQNVIYGKDAVAWDHFNPALERFELYARFDEKTIKAMNRDSKFLEENSGSKIE